MTSIEIFLKNQRVQKTLTTKPGEEGFSLVELVVVIAVLAILSAVAIPAFNGVQANARASAAKNGLVNVIKECIVLDSNTVTGDETWANSQSKNGNYSGYTFGNTDGTCFSGTATPDQSKAGKESVFVISLDTSTGISTKTCTNPETNKIAPGCNSNNTW